MKASDITNRVGRLLSDPTHVRWSEGELIDYINDAQRQIVLLVPDANSKTGPFSVTANQSKQTLPTDAIQLLRITRNLPNGRVIYPTLRSAIDAEIPTWHSATGNEVEHYIYDPNADRKTFYVYPQLTAVKTVELVYSTIPEPVTSLSQTLELSDQYINPVVDWVLYRAWAKDAEYAGNASRAQMHEGSFYQQIGVKDQVADMNNPNRRVRSAEVDGTVR